MMFMLIVMMFIVMFMMMMFTICSMTAHFKSRVHTNCWALDVTFSVGWFFACYRFHCLIFLPFLLVIGFIILIFCRFFNDHLIHWTTITQIQIQMQTLGPWPRKYTNSTNTNILGPWPKKEPTILWNPSLSSPGAILAFPFTTSPLAEEFSSGSGHRHSVFSFGGFRFQLCLLGIAAAIMNEWRSPGRGRGQLSVWIFTKLKTDFPQHYSQKICMYKM